MLWLPVSCGFMALKSFNERIALKYFWWPLKHNCIDKIYVPAARSSCLRISALMVLNLLLSTARVHPAVQANSHQDEIHSTMHSVAFVLCPTMLHRKKVPCTHRRTKAEDGGHALVHWQNYICMHMKSYTCMHTHTTATVSTWMSSKIEAMYINAVWYKFGVVQIKWGFSAGWRM